MADEEIFSEGKALHRILFNSTEINSSIRVYRHRYKNNKLNSNIIHNLLIEHGYIKVEDAIWKK